MKSLPLKTAAKPVVAVRARGCWLASSAGISRRKMLRQRISPPWVWSWIGPLRRDGRLAVVVVLHDGVIDDELVVEPDADARADHDDAELVPFAEGLVGQHQRVLARRARRCCSTGRPSPCPRRCSNFAFSVESQICTCGHAAQVDAGVGLGHGLVVDEQLEVAVVLLGGGVGAVAVVDQFAVLDAPVRLAGLALTPSSTRSTSRSARRARPASWPAACGGRRCRRRASRSGPCR